MANWPVEAEIESIANFVCCMMDPEHSRPPPRLPLRAILPSLILTLFAIQYITVMMQSDHDGEEPTEADHTTPSVAGGKAQWNSVEVSAFVDYLHEHRAERGDAGNFKPSVYSAAATAIGPHRTSGPPKTGAMCKNKWTSVCDCH